MARRLRTPSSTLVLRRTGLGNGAPRQRAGQQAFSLRPRQSQPRVLAAVAACSSSSAAATTTTDSTLV